MSGSTQITATLIPVGADLGNVQRGDALVVVNNVCVDVQKRSIVSSVVKPAKGPSRGRRPKTPKPGLPSVEERDEIILGALRENGPMEARQMLDRLGQSVQGHRTDYHNRLTILQGRGTIRKVKADQHKRFPRYELVP